MSDQLDPADALAITRNARTRLARHAAMPSWYAPLYGLGSGVMVASLVFRGPAQILVEMLALIGVLALYSRWKRQSGLSVTGFRRGRTMPITVALVLAAIVAFVVAFSTRDIPGYGWTPLACGAVFGVFAGFASAAWDRAWIADMEDDR